jgi:hypothetical protein
VATVGGSGRRSDCEGCRLTHKPNVATRPQAGWFYVPLGLRVAVVASKWRVLIAKPEMQAPYDQNNVIFVASIDGSPDSVANGVAYPFPL